MRRTPGHWLRPRARTARLTLSGRGKDTDLHAWTHSDARGESSQGKLLVHSYRSYTTFSMVGYVPGR